MDYMGQVQNINLSAELNRMQTKAGLDQDTAKEAVDLYQKFLFLRLKYGTGLTPSKLIDYAWHEHLADTRKYMDDCIKLCGTVIHHDPKITGDVMEERFSYTNELFQKEFGIDLTKMTHNDYGRAEGCGC